MQVNELAQRIRGFYSKDQHMTVAQCEELAYKQFLVLSLVFGLLAVSVGAIIAYFIN